MDIFNGFECQCLTGYAGTLTIYAQKLETKRPFTVYICLKGKRAISTWPYVTQPTKYDASTVAYASKDSVYRLPASVNRVGALTAHSIDLMATN